jgi:hypothetical protein
LPISAPRNDLTIISGSGSGYFPRGIGLFWCKEDQPSFFLNARYRVRLASFETNRSVEDAATLLFSRSMMVSSGLAGAHVQPCPRNEFLFRMPSPRACHSERSEEPWFRPAAAHAKIPRFTRDDSGKDDTTKR